MKKALFSVVLCDPDSYRDSVKLSVSSLHFCYTGEHREATEN